jgi:hypothetical protein
VLFVEQGLLSLSSHVAARPRLAGAAFAFKGKASLSSVPVFESFRAAGRSPLDVGNEATE